MIADAISGWCLQSQEWRLLTLSFALSGCSWNPWADWPPAEVLLHMRLTIVERSFSVWLSQNCSLEMLEDARLWGELITPKAEESFPRVMSRNAWYEVDVHTNLAFTCYSCLWFWNELKKCTNIKYAWQLTPHNGGHFKDSLFLCSTRYCCPVTLSPTYSFLMPIPSFKASMHIQKPRSAGCFTFWYSPPSAPDNTDMREHSSQLWNPQQTPHYFT